MFWWYLLEVLFLGGAVAAFCVCFLASFEYDDRAGKYGKEEYDEWGERII